MKRLIIAALGLALLVGCGGSGSDASKAPSPEGVATEAAASTLTAEQLAYVEAVATQKAVQATASAISARETVAARPTNTPIPPPYKLALISSTCTYEYGFERCEGYVKNITSGALENVEVVITWGDANGTPYSTDDALIDYNPILPGQESPWSTIGTYNPALTRYRVGFKDLLGGTILTRDDRQ